MNANKVGIARINPYLLVAVLFTFLALVFYFKTSDDLSTQNSVVENIKDSGQFSQNTQISTDTSIKVASVEDLVDGLRAKLETSPDDMQGWVLLAKSYYHVQRWEDATAAFNRAKLLGYTGEIPWSKPNTNIVKPVTPFNNNFLQDYFARQRDKNEQSAFGKTKDISEMGSAAKAVAVNLVLSLDPAIKDKLDPNLTVYIFARASNTLGVVTRGPPLAALRMLVSDLPVSLSLNDQMAVVPGRTISSVEQLVVGARVSLSGNAIRQYGDFEQISAPISSTFKNVVPLVISKQVADKGSS